MSSFEDLVILPTSFLKSIRSRSSKSLPNHPSPTKKRCLFRQSSVELENPLTTLPLAVSSCILGKLTIIDLSQLAISSIGLRRLVISYCIHPKSGPRRLIPYKVTLTKGSNFLWSATEDDRKRNIKLFQHLGVLVKLVTCNLPTSERLKIALEFLEKLTLSLPDCKKMKEESHSQKSILEYFGEFCDRMFRGWNEKECLKVFQFFDQKFRIDSVISLIFSAPVGSYNHCEYFIRCYYRLMCLDHLENVGERMLWLSMILEKHCKVTSNRDVNKAKLLAILYAPTTKYDENGEDENLNGIALNGHHNYQENGIVGGHELQVVSIAWSSLSTHFYLDELKELGRSIFWLYQTKHKPLWDDEDIILLVRNLTNLSSTWAIPNVAALLHHCGESIVKMCLRNYYLQREPEDAALLIVYINYVAYKLNSFPEWILEVVDEFWSSDAPLEIRSKLIAKIPQAFDLAFSDFLYFVDLDYLDMDELQDFMSSTTSLMSSLLRKSYQITDQTMAHHV